MPGTVKVSPVSKSTSLDQQIDGLLSGVRWDTLSLTYSFPTLTSDYESRYGSREPEKNFQPFAANEQAPFKTIFDQISSFSKLTFSEAAVAKNGDIRIGQSDLQNAEAWAYYPSTSPQGGDAWFDNNLRYESSAQGSYKYTVYMHEIGHSLGLKHSFEKGPLGTVPIDSLEYTVMSYSSHAGANDWFAPEYNYPQTYMMYDIAALQYMYGEDFSFNNKNTIYKWEPGSGELQISEDGGGFQSAVKPEANKVFLTIWDGGGTDTFDFSAYTTGVNVNLQPGQWTTTSTDQLADLGNGNTAAGNIANAFLYQNSTASLIENAIGGSGDDAFIGNKLANTFWGGEGFDTVIYQGLPSEYAVSGAGDNWTVASTRDGTDQLYGFEFIQFGDGSRFALEASPPPSGDSGGGPKKPPGKPQKYETLVANSDAPANAPAKFAPVKSTFDEDILGGVGSLPTKALAAFASVAVLSNHAEPGQLPLSFEQHHDWLLG